MASSTLLIEKFPPEVIANVLDFTLIKDDLALKMTCKTFKAHLPERLSDKLRQSYAVDEGSYASEENPTAGQNAIILYRAAHVAKASKAQSIAIHARLEASLGSVSRLKCLLCTQCGRIKPRAGFTDQEAATKLTSIKRLANPTQYRPVKGDRRTCIDCGLNDGRLDYAIKGTFEINGKSKFACGTCHQIRPANEEVVLQLHSLTILHAMDILGPKNVAHKCLSCAQRCSIWICKKRRNGVGYTATAPSQDRLMMENFHESKTTWCNDNDE